MCHRQGGNAPPVHMKTASEILIEAVHLKESGDTTDTGKVLELLTELARIVDELEHQHGAPAEERPTGEAQEPA